MPSLSNIIGQASRGADLYFVFRFLRLLTMDFKKTDAFKFGIIDKKGKALRKSADLESVKEKAAYTMLHRMVFKIRRLILKVPLVGKSILLNYAAALFLLKEQKNARIWTDDGYMKSKLLEFLETDWEADAKFLKEEVDNMDKKSFKTFLSENKTIEEVELDEGISLQVKMALDDVGISGTFKDGKVYVKKSNIGKAKSALKGNVFYKGKPPEVAAYSEMSEEVEIEEVVNLKKLKKEYDKNEDQNRHTENYLMLAKAFGSKSEVKKVQDIMKRNEKQGHTSKSDMDWMYKNINPYYDKIRNEETMKLEDTVKQVLVGKKEEPTVEEQKVKKEDTDKDEPGTQGDMKKYQAARAKVMKKFGVKSCSELEGDEKKACYAALDAAHVSDDEEEKGEKKEEVKKTFSKMFSHVKSLMQGK